MKYWCDGQDDDHQNDNQGGVVSSLIRESFLRVCEGGNHLSVTFCHLSVIFRVTLGGGGTDSFYLLMSNAMPPALVISFWSLHFLLLFSGGFFVPPPPSCPLDVPPSALSSSPFCTACCTESLRWTILDDTIPSDGSALSLHCIWYRPLLVVSPGCRPVSLALWARTVAKCAGCRWSVNNVIYSLHVLHNVRVVSYIRPQQSKALSARGK